MLKSFPSMARDIRTHYQHLGIPHDATPNDIEHAYRNLKARMQEDAAAPDPRTAILVRTAYEILSDPARRAGYDERLRAAPREVLRRTLERRRQWIGGSAAALVVAVGVAAWIVVPPTPASPSREASEILADAALAVGRLQLVELSGRSTDVGLAFALDKGALATTCTGVRPGAQLVVSFAQRQVPARVAREGTAVCRLTADGLGSWPLHLREGLPARGEKVYGVRLDATNQAHLVEGSVRTVLASDDGVQTIEVRGAAASQPVGGPLIDMQGRVLGIAIGSGRYRPVPTQWMAELHAPPEGPPPPPAPPRRASGPKHAPKDLPPEFIDEYNHKRANALKVPDDI